MPLKLEDAQRLIDAAHQHGRASGWRVTVAVVDEGGALQALGKMDGATPVSSQIAEAKAVGCAVWLREGESLQQVQADRGVPPLTSASQEVQAVLEDLTDPRYRGVRAGRAVPAGRP